MEIIAIKRSKRKAELKLKMGKRAIMKGMLKRTKGTTDIVYVDADIANNGNTWMHEREQEQMCGNAKNNRKTTKPSST